MILNEAIIDPDTKSDVLTDDQIATIRQIIDAKCKVEGDLRTEVSMNIKRPGEWRDPPLYAALADEWPVSSRTP